MTLLGWGGIVVAVLIAAYFDWKRERGGGGW